MKVTCKENKCSVELVIGTAGDWDCVVTVKSLPALHHSVVFFSSPLGSLIPFRNFEDILGSLMRPSWPKLASCPRKLCILEPGRVAQSVEHLTRKSEVLGSILGLATYFRFSFR